MLFKNKIPSSILCDWAENAELREQFYLWAICNYFVKDFNYLNAQNTYTLDFIV